jgi:two-component system CitB family sensor kinase
VHRPRIRFAHQVLALQVGVVTLVVGVGFILVSYLLDDELTNQYRQRALAVARTVAADASIAAEADREDPDHVIQQRAEAARRASDALFVVVTDREGLRLSHPNPELIGKPVSTDPREALAGREVVSTEQGTLGLSARAKVPLRNAGGSVVGEVSVGFDADDVTTEVARLLALAGTFLGGALLLGVAGSALLSRRLKRLTLGLEPHELSEMVQEHEAVLHGIGEGVLAADATGRITVGNGEASRLLGVELPVGVALTELDLPAGIRAALAADEPVDNLITIAGDRVLVANHRLVRRDGRDLGRVLTLRDRTDLEALTRELDAVRALTAALRAQRHEFANRLHVLSGLLQTGHTAEAIDYLAAVSAGPAGRLSPDSEVLRDPYLQAFLGAKIAEATERAVRLSLSETTWVPARVTAPVEVTTVIGNLIDNALEAARLGERRPAWVEADLISDGDTLHVTVSDSGPGVPDDFREHVFVEGMSTRDGGVTWPGSAGTAPPSGFAAGDRGLGLAIARQAARSTGGDITLADGKGDDHGAVFVARLPGVLVESAEGP